MVCRLPIGPAYRRRDYLQAVQPALEISPHPHPMTNLSTPRPVTSLPLLRNSARATRRKDPLPSKARVGFAGKIYKITANTRSCLSLLLTVPTADHAITLTDPVFKATQAGNLDGPQATLKFSSHVYFPRLLEAADRIRSP
jgi:hypothetical protein